MTDGFDERLRARAEREPFPIPEDYAGRVFRTCAALEETAAAKKRGMAGGARRWAACAAVFLALLCVGAISSSSAFLEDTSALNLMWSIADTLNGMMAIPNLIALLLLSGVTARLTKQYFKTDSSL